MKGKATNLFCLCFLSLLSYPQAFGQATPGRREAIRARLAQIKAFSERIPAKQRKILSSGALGLLEASDKFDDLQRGLSGPQPARSTPMSQQSRAAAALAHPLPTGRQRRCGLSG